MMATTSQTTDAQLESAAYRDGLLKVLERVDATQMAHLADRAILTAAVITGEFAKRFPDAYDAWNQFAEEGDTTCSK